MTFDVFISYAHAGGALEAVRALAKRLADDGLSVFLDERSIPHGSAFPRDIADALLAARQVVMFVDEVYFTRPWCVYEAQVVMAPYRAAAEPADEQLAHVTVVLPAEGYAGTLVPHLPPPLARGSWPRAGQTGAIAELVEARATTGLQPLGSRLEAVNDDAVQRLRSGGDIPLPWAPPRSSEAEEPPAASPLCLDLLPDTRSQAFIGRAAELWRVFHYLVTCRAFSRVRHCGIQGMGGSGKSRLAAEFVARYGGRFFPGGVVWIDAGGDLATLVDQFRRVLAVLAPGQADPSREMTDPEQQREALAGALAAHCRAWPHSRRLLWVVDDVPESAPGRAGRPLDYWCPALDDVNLLTTSRRRGLGRLDAHVDLGPLALPDAVDWLTRPEVDRRWLKDSEWEDLVRWAGALPLAIALLHTSLKDGYTTTRALRLAQSREPSLVLDKEMDALRGEVDDARLRGVTEAFDFSYRLLAGEHDLLHAAHLLACLAPYPLAEHLLAELVAPPLIGRLVRRSWLQRSVGGGGGRGRRHYVMHRIPASFLRARMADPATLFGELFQWLGRAVSGDPDEEDERALSHHLMVIGREFAAVLEDLPEDAPVIAIARDFSVRAATRITGPGISGLRYLAAQLAHRLGAGEQVAERLRQRYEAGDEDVAAAIPHTLQALPGSTAAVELMARLLGDHRRRVSQQAIVHAGALADPRLAWPMLDAILHTEMRGPEGFYDVYLRNDCPVLADVLSQLLHYLNEGSDRERRWAATLLGRTLMLNRPDVQAGGYTGRHLRGALLRIAREDPRPEVVEAAVKGASVDFDREAYDSLVEALTGADGEARARVLQVMGDYLAGTRNPPAPRVRELKILDEGGMRLELDLGQAREALPDGVYDPLLDVAEGDDEGLARVAMAGIMRTPEGQRALGDRAHRLLEQQAHDTVASLSTRAIAQDPEFVNANWWRGQARLALGDARGALADFDRVLEKTPDFIDARYWRGRAREALHDTQGAVADFAAVIAREDDWQDAYYRHGTLLCQGQAFAEALPSLQRAAELAPADFLAHHMLAFCLYNLQRHEAAEAAATRAIEIDPTVAETWFFRGVARYAAGKAEEALEDLRQAAALDPADERVSQFLEQLEGYLGGSG